MTARHTGNTHVVQLSNNQQCTAGQQQMFYAGARGGMLSAVLLVTALVELGFVLSYPWWRYPKPPFVSLEVLLAASCVVLPFAFLMGWGARHCHARLNRPVLSLASGCIRVIPEGSCCLWWFAPYKCAGCFCLKIASVQGWRSHVQI